MILDRLALQAGTFFTHLHPEDALEANDIQVEKIILKLFREMPAGENAGAGTGTRRPLPEFFQVVRVLGREFQIAAEGRAEVAVVAGRIGNDVVAPIIKHASVRV